MYLGQEVPKKHTVSGPSGTRFQVSLQHMLPEPGSQVSWMILTEADTYQICPCLGSELDIAK